MPDYWLAKFWVHVTGWTEIGLDVIMVPRTRSISAKLMVAQLALRTS